MNYFEKLVSAAASGNGQGMVLWAMMFGIDPYGSNSGSTGSAQSRAPTVDECRRAFADLPDIHVELPAPQAPPPRIGAAHCYSWCILPGDYGGLGVDPDTGAFRLELLVRHCQQLPLASMNAAAAAIATPGRMIACQAFGCCDLIAESSNWVVCGGCRLAVFCQLCHANRGCRVCLFNSRITAVPTEWIFNRRRALLALNKRARESNYYLDTDVHQPGMVVIYMLAIMAAYAAAGPRRRTSR